MRSATIQPLDLPFSSRSATSRSRRPIRRPHSDTRVPSLDSTMSWTCFHWPTVTSESPTLSMLDLENRMFSAPTRPSCALVIISSFHRGWRGVARKMSRSSAQWRSSTAFDVGGSQPSSESSLSERSRLHRSSTELCTAVPMAAGILALRGSLCRESQYFRGQSS